MDQTRTIQIEIPYTPSLGKNKMKGFAKGRYYTTKEYKEACKSLSDIVWGHSRGVKWKKDKIWVEIFLQKPRMVCDVSNFIDGIYDSIKTGIDIDDCYFSGEQDWEYDKDVKPYIIITITQHD